MDRSTERNAQERERVVGLLRGHAADLRAHGVRGLGLFGSVACGEARPESDVDLLVDLDRESPLGFGVVGLSEELHRLLGRPVGLAFVSRLRPEMRARVERDLVRVF